jgi:arginyl-tRNA synthetase
MEWDLVLFLEPDVPFVQDGTRNEEIARQRRKYSQEIKALFDRYHIPCETVEGDYLQRFDTAKEIIAEKNPNADEAFIADVAHQVGIGAVIFQELSNNRIKDYVFKWDKVLNFDGETGPYVQYTHARCCSVMRKAGEEVCAKAASGDIDYSKITSKSAFELTRLLYELPNVVHEAADRYEPSLITRHVVDIAQAYNRFYHDEHILADDENERIAKVALTIAAKNGIKRGLALLGMHAPERM